MKKILLMLAIITVIQNCGNIPAFADAETDAHQVYISKIQSKNIKYAESGLFEAISNDDSLTVELFMKAGMSPNATYMKVPALYFAISSGAGNSVQTLIEYGADVNRIQMGFTPLMFAINRKQAEVAKILVNAGAEVNTNISGMTPVNYALKKKQLSTAKFLIDAGAKVNDETVIRAIKSDDKNLKNAVFNVYNK